MNASAVLAIALACGACAAGPNRRQSSNPDRLTREEILATRTTDAYEAVLRVRPRWLRARTPNQNRPADPVIVYLDGVRMGDASALRRLDPDAIREIRYLNAADATTRYGTGHASGALVVTTVNR